MIVVNGDLLTKINFSSLLEFHEECGAKGTMCVREYDFKVPYGVVNIDGTNLRGIEEKPVKKFFVNAGIYVLDPSVLGLIPNNVFFDMTTLFKDLLSENKQTAVFPLREYWIDVGGLEDFDRASNEYDNEFE